MSKRDKIILTDADGTCIDWSGAFREYMEGNGYNHIPNSEHNYRLELCYEDLDYETAQIMVGEFNNSEQIRNLDALEYSVEYIGKLVDDGFKFICITSLSDTPEARENREYNLQALFGDAFLHESMVCLPIGMNKHEALSTWAGTGYFWCEDHFMHAQSGYEHGLQTVLIDTPYNAHFETDLFPRVESWKEIYDIITKSYS